MLQRAVAILEMEMAGGASMMLRPTRPRRRRPRRRRRRRRSTDSVQLGDLVVVKVVRKNVACVSRCVSVSLCVSVIVCRHDPWHAFVHDSMPAAAAHIGDKVFGRNYFEPKMFHT